MRLPENLDLSVFPPAERAVLEEYLRRQALRKKGQSFLDFAQHVMPFIVIEEVHCLLADHFEQLRRGDIDRLMIAMPPRTGKLLADSTPILTQQGWATHGTLRVGDVVFHPSGAPVMVEAVSPEGVADHEVEFDTGEVVKCHGAHEWTVFDRSRNKYRTVETKWFLGKTSTGGQRKLWQAGKRVRYSLPDVAGVEFPAAEQPTKFALRRKIGVVDVRKTASPESGHCVQVSSSDGLYVVGKTFLATHNSLLTSELLPAWWEGHFPSDKVLHASYAATLVEKFGRKIRNMVASPEYQQVFPGTVLTKDSRAAAQWATTEGGEYNAVGVGGGVAGKGGNLLLVDDPMSEQDMFSRSVMDGIYEWYGAGFYSRRQPDRNAFVITMTRWNIGDLSGRLLADAVTKEGADQWTQLVIPAILDDRTASLLNQYNTDPHITQPHHYKAGDSFSPRRWPLPELQRTKNTVSRKAWAALYLQSPVEDGGGILQRDHWKPWKPTTLPRFEFILQGYDTAFEEGESNDFSVRITWGVFKRESDGKLCVLMLERMKERLSFPSLLDNALEAYREYAPDRIIIEKAASGIPLLQEFRRRGIPVAPIHPKGSKIARANAAAVVLEQGVVYYPFGKRWAEDVIDECAAFPNAQHDDVPDVVAHSLNYFRRMFLLEAPDDEEDDEDEMDAPVKRSYATRRSRLSVTA